MVLRLSRMTCYPSWLSTNWSSKRKNIWSRTSSMESWSSIIQGLMIKQPDANSKCFKRINNQHFQKTTLFGRRGKRFCAACDTHLYQSIMAFSTASKPEIDLMSSSNWCADWNVRLEGGQQPPLLKVSPWFPNLQFLGGRWAQGARSKESPIRLPRGDTTKLRSTKRLISIEFLQKSEKGRESKNVTADALFDGALPGPES